MSNKTYDTVTKINIDGSKYGYLAKYTGNNGTVYIAYDSNNKGKSTSVPLSGDVAYVYDYLGNVTETINNPSGSKSITMTSSPVYVECRTYNTNIDSVTYNRASKMLSVNGSCNLGDKCTIELINPENEVVKSISANIVNYKFNESISIETEDLYTVRVGYPESNRLGKTSWASTTIETREEVPTLTSGTVAAYNAATRTVSISGSVIFPTENQNITLFAMPSTMTPLQYDPAAVACVKQIQAPNGSFSTSFSLPEWYGGEMAVYIGGTQIKAKQTKILNVEEADHAYISVFDAENTSNVVTASAKAKNSSDEAKKIKIIIAGYNGMRLQSVYTEEKTIPANTYTSLDVSASTNIPVGVTKVMAYVWDSMEGLMPLTEAVEVK